MVTRRLVDVAVFIATKKLLSALAPAFHVASSAAISFLSGLARLPVVWPMRARRDILRSGCGGARVASGAGGALDRCRGTDESAGGMATAEARART